MDTLVVESVLNSIQNNLYDVRVMNNVFRSHFAEHLVQIGLGEEFELKVDWAA